MLIILLGLCRASVEIEFYVQVNGRIIDIYINDVFLSNKRMNVFPLIRPSLHIIQNLCEDNFQTFPGKLISELFFFGNAQNPKAI